MSLSGGMSALSSETPKMDGGAKSRGTQSEPSKGRTSRSRGGGACGGYAPGMERLPVDEVLPDVLAALGERRMCVLVAATEA